MLAEISDATKITISSAGSARKPTIISRRAPSVPNAVPMSIAASDMNTRAVASNPTSAIASAAFENGSRVPIDGMMAAAHTIEPNTTYGAKRNSGDAFAASTASLWNSLWIVAIRLPACSARDLFCSHARHCVIQPTNSGATAIAASTSSACVSQGSEAHSTSPSSTISVTKL